MSVAPNILMVICDETRIRQIVLYTNNSPKMIHNLNAWIYSYDREYVQCEIVKLYVNILRMLEAATGSLRDCVKSRFFLRWGKQD